MIRGDEFVPRPQVPAVILVARRLANPTVRFADRVAYWRFATYLLERSQLTVGDALAPLRLAGIPRSVRHSEVRSVAPETAVELFRVVQYAGAGASQTMAAFEASLPAPRRTNIGMDGPGKSAQRSPRRR